MIITPGDFEAPQIIALLRLHMDGMHATSPPGTVFALDRSGLNRPDIAFFGAWDGPDLLGCGALRALSAEHGEIKSMRTHPDHMRKGVAAAILRHALAIARDRTYRRVSLETGSAPAFQPAVALYTRFGFRAGAPFGDYVENGFSQFFHLDLTEACAGPNDGRI